MALQDPSDSDRETVNRAVALMRTGSKGRDQAASLLYNKMYGRLLRYFRNQQVAPHEAEELVSDTIFSFILSNPSGQHTSSAIAYFWKIATNAMRDMIAKKRAAKRGADQKMISIDDEDDQDWQQHRELSSRDLAEVSALRNCMERATVLFQREHPKLGDVLMFIGEKFSMKEIAEALDISEDAAKQRVRHARKVAVDYFKKCKE